MLEKHVEVESAVVKVYKIYNEVSEIYLARRIRDTGQFSRTTGWNDGFASQYGRWSDIGHGYDSRRQI